MNQLQKTNGQTYIMNSTKWILTFGKEFLKSHSTRVEKQTYKLFNIEQYIASFHSTKGSSILKLNLKKTCNYCTDEDDNQHFFLKCDKANTFWKY